MPKYNFSPRKLVKLLKTHGFYFVRQNGSHAIFRHPNNPKRIVVPIHSKDVPTGTAHAILKDAGIKI